MLDIFVCGYFALYNFHVLKNIKFLVYTLSSR